jgi:hypothetical protein
MVNMNKMFSFVENNFCNLSQSIMFENCFCFVEPNHRGKNEQIAEILGFAFSVP